MSKFQPSNRELVRRLEPWFPLFGRVGGAAMRDHLAAIPILGLPRKTERANDVHRAIRENFRPVCDLADPLMSLSEGPDGDGLDCLICRMVPDSPFAIRWGRYNGVTIRRNRTERSKVVHDEGMLLFGVPDLIEEKPDEMITVSLGYAIEDDYTEAGKPCWWMSRLYLLRERAEKSEIVTEVHVYSPPDRSVDSEQLPPPAVAARESERAEWARIIEAIRRSA